MPELPDLHVYSINLKKMILGRTITSVRICNPRKFDTPDIFRQTLTGTNIRDIVREGKELHFLLANNNSFGVHLMLSGKFFIANENDDGPISGKILALDFEDHQSFVIADYQGLCKVSLNPKAGKAPDALSEQFTFDYFTRMIHKNALKNIKAVLIDQNAVRGIGNAYVDEILWKADISPESVSGKIPETKIKDLYEAISFTLHDAIQNILKIAPDIINGEERSFLRVHNPRKKCTDNGDKIIKKTIATKTTYFTDRQQLYI